MAPENVETLILRFRDLATARGETLREHRRILDQRLFVWWGWWNKFGERVPVGTFERLNNRPLEVILFDSGENRIYHARISQIVWDREHGRKIAPPEADATPEYYKRNTYAAWFRLDQLNTDPLPARRLQEFTYEEVSEFFESGHSRFGAIYGKQVESPEELQDQNRTIWFVRRYRHGDRTGFARIEVPRPDQPFSTDAITSYSNTVLWLSDLHFGQHAFPVDAGDAYRRDLSQALEQDLRSIERNSLAAAIISGDLTWENADAEFDQAQAFVNRLRSWSTLDARRVLVNTGNHDLKWSDQPATMGVPATVAGPEAKRAYTRFYNGLYGHEPNADLSLGRRLLIRGGLPVDVIALNTSHLGQFKGAFQGQGFVGHQQLEAAAKAMDWKSPISADAPRAFRAVVIHHHLVPVTFRPTPTIGYGSSVLFDAEAVTRWLIEHRVDLVLHGHMHDPFFARISRPLLTDKRGWHTFHVAGLGSSGVAPEHLGDEKYHTYGMIEFSRESYKMTVRRIDPRGSVQENHRIVFEHDIPFKL